MEMKTLIQKAEELRKAQNFADAIDVYSAALAASNNTSYPAAYGAGRSAGGARDYEKALHFFEIAARISPNKQAPLIEMANLNYRLARFEDALSTLSRANKIDILSESAELIKLKCLFGIEDYHGALSLCEEALQRNTDYIKHYQWQLRKLRCLFFMGQLTKADALAQTLKDLDANTVHERFHVDDSQIEPIDVFLNCYRRPNEVKFQKWWITHQSIPVKNFWVWHNYGGDEYLQQPISGAHNALNDENHKFYGRFSYGLLSDAKYLAYFDDDTIPGPYWLQNCLHQMQKQTALYVAVGVKLLEKGKYAPHERSGWVTGDQDDNVLADLGGHSWFFDRDWLRYFWFEKPSTYETGEDMHLSFAVQKHLDLNTISPPHPKDCVGAWGSILGFEIGQDLGSSSMAKAKSHFSQRDYCVTDLNIRGWKLLDAK